MDFANSADAVNHQAILYLSKCVVRPYAPNDADSLAKAANNPNVAYSLRNIFPQPYTLADAEWWIQHTTSSSPITNFALIHPSTGLVMGSIGVTLKSDVHVRTAELGYWLGEEYWGQGIMGLVVPAFVDWAFRNLKVKDKAGVQVGLTRIWAEMYARNGGSEAVVKKAGFVFEGRQSASVWKDGEVMDQLVYAMTKDNWSKIFGEK